MDKKKTIGIVLAVAAALGYLAEQLKDAGYTLPAWVVPVVGAVMWLLKSPIVAELEQK